MIFLRFRSAEKCEHSRSLPVIAIREDIWGDGGEEGKIKATSIFCVQQQFQPPFYSSLFIIHHFETPTSLFYCVRYFKTNMNERECKG